MIITTTTRKVRALDKRIRAVQGGTSAGKTISILQHLIDLAQRDKKRTVTSVVSESLPHLKRGAIRDFLNIMHEQGYYNDARWNRTDFIYTFESGSIIEFFGADQSMKVRGPRRQRLFLNEVNNIDFETFTQLEIRTSQFLIMDWNPSTEFWFYTVLQKEDNDLPEDRKQIDFIIVTYKDNEGLDEAIVDSIERKSNRPSWWRVFGLGLLGEIEGQIYKNWKVIDELPHEAKLANRGLDFGYTNDPSALVAIYRWNGGYILDEELYARGMKNRELADTIKGQEEWTTLVVGDSAEPKSIDEIKEYGVNIVGATKKAPEGRSMAYNLWAIQKIQGLRISVTKRSTNLIRESRNYLHYQDKDGVWHNEPDPDSEDHALDAAKYGLIFAEGAGEDDPNEENRRQDNRESRVHNARKDAGV